MRVYDTYYRIITQYSWDHVKNLKNVYIEEYSAKKFRQHFHFFRVEIVVEYLTHV